MLSDALASLEVAEAFSAKANLSTRLEHTNSKVDFSICSMQITPDMLQNMTDGWRWVGMGFFGADTKSHEFAD